MVYRCTRTATLRNQPENHRRCSKNHVPCGEQSAGPVLTTKVAFVPALRSGQETSSAATWPRSEWDAVEPFRVYWRPTNGWARGASTLRDGAILVVRTTRQFAIIFGGMTCAFSRRWLRRASRWCLPRLLNGKMELNSRNVSLSHLPGLLRREIHEDE
jgi:hypothetical protein